MSTTRLLGKISDESPSAAAALPPTNACGCPVCGGRLIEIRHKLHCEQCHAIVETCCEGGRG